MVYGCKALSFVSEDSLSQQVECSFAWDPIKGQVFGDEEAICLLRRAYRAPWVHPDPANV